MYEGGGDGEQMNQVDVDDVVEEGNLSEYGEKPRERAVCVLEGSEQDQRRPQRHHEIEQRWGILLAIEEGE